MKCTKLPDVHLNLLLWLPVGVDVKFWADPSFVADYGPLGPIHNWELFAKNRRPYSSASSELQLPLGCARLLNNDDIADSFEAVKARQLYPNLLNKTDIHEDRNSNNDNDRSNELYSGQMMQVSQLHFDNNNCLKFNTFKYRAITLCHTSSTSSSSTSSSSSSRTHRTVNQQTKYMNNNENYCRSEAYQAVKIAWAKLQTAAPAIHQLATRMYLTHDDIYEIHKWYESNRTSDQLSISVYENMACRWLRQNPTKWKQWTMDWDKKLNLTIAGMFSLFGKWILSGLDRVAQEAVQFVNADSDYFGNSEYSLSLEVHNLTCESDLILSDYFKILENAENKHLIGSIAALCSDSIEAVVELANIRKQIVISPTVATARFLEQQHFEYFFRTVPSMTQANLILLRLFLKWGWHRMVVFRKVDHFFDPLLFQTKGIEIIADIEMDEGQLTYKIAKHTLGQLKQLNSRIFVIEYDARGTYLVLCAAYHEGMHFAAGYVWFLNPRLSDQWWSSLMNSNSECTFSQMANITSWTFTVGHQLLIGPMVHSFIPLTSQFLNNEIQYNTDPFKSVTNQSVINPSQLSADNVLRRFRRLAPITTSKQISNSNNNNNNLGKPNVMNDPMHDYSVYTYDAVIVLASAVVHLLRENPNSISALNQPSVAELLKNLVAQTNFGYRFQKPHNFSSFYADEQFALETGFQSAGDYYGIRNQGPASASNLRFNENNERVADYWLLKQRQLNTTVPIIMWSTKGNQELIDELESDEHDKESVVTDSNMKQIGPVNKSVVTTSITTTIPNATTSQANHNAVDRKLTTSGQMTKSADRGGVLSATGHTILGAGSSKSISLPFLYDQFEESMSERWLDPVNWASLGAPPHDGSISKADCIFPFLSNQLKLGCTGATVTVTVLIILAILLPLIVFAHIHYQRKLREVERLTRKPFEELCAELADLDIPAENIVLNRRVGQGAFGLVYGGEAKKNDIWEAVAVKSINDKATYERKIDFLSEAKLMRSLEHSNVIRLIGISLNPKANPYLIMELMLFGDLKTYLLSRRNLAQSSPNHDDVKPATLTKMATDIAQGVAYLHSKNLIHRDIACRNCLVSTDRTVKIGDFGLTREAAKHNTEGYYRFTRNCELPIRWMSPEAVQFGVFSVRSDIWSYGITLYEIITFGVFPYNGLGDVEVVERVKRMEFSITEFLPPKAMNTIVCHFINQCCKHQWQHRPASMNEVLEWLNNYPNCIQPFLTDDPPKPITTMDSLPFQPPITTACATSEPATVPFMTNLDESICVMNTSHTTSSVNNCIHTINQVITQPTTMNSFSSIDQNRFPNNQHHTNESMMLNYHINPQYYDHLSHNHNQFANIIQYSQSSHMFDTIEPIGQHQHLHQHHHHHHHGRHHHHQHQQQQQQHPIYQSQFDPLIVTTTINNDSTIQPPTENTITCHFADQFDSNYHTQQQPNPNLMTNIVSSSSSSGGGGGGGDNQQYVQNRNTGVTVDEVNDNENICTSKSSETIHNITNVTINNNNNNNSNSNLNNELFTNTTVATTHETMISSAGMQLETKVAASFGDNDNVQQQQQQQQEEEEERHDINYSFNNRESDLSRPLLSENNCGSSDLASQPVYRIRSTASRQSVLNWLDVVYRNLTRPTSTNSSQSTVAKRTLSMTDFNSTKHDF